MKISFIVPVLNSGRTVAQTIESILAQTYDNIEIIVQDGGSTDGTLETLAKYGNKIQLKSEKDSGSSDASNRGWSRSTGEFFTFLNADDYLAHPRAVEQVVNHLRQNPQTDIICGDIDIVDQETGTITDKACCRPDRLLWGVTIFIPGTFMNRRLMEIRKLSYNMRFANDYDAFNYWVHKAHAKVLYVPEVSVCFRRGGVSDRLKNQLQIEREMFLTRRTYYGLGLAVVFWAYGILKILVRGLKIRPFFWMRILRVKLSS